MAKQKSHKKRFERLFCHRTESGDYVCKTATTDEGDEILISDNGMVAYAENLDKFNDFFYCDYAPLLKGNNNEKKEIYACIWNHEKAQHEDMVIRKTSDANLVETKRIAMAGKHKKIPVVRKGCSVIDMENLERALKTFKGDEVEIIYHKDKKKDCLYPVVVKDKKTGEAIFLTPYYTAPLKP